MNKTNEANISEKTNRANISEQDKQGRNYPVGLTFRARICDVYLVYHHLGVDTIMADILHKKIFK